MLLIIQDKSTKFRLLNILLFAGIGWISAQPAHASETASLAPLLATYHHELNSSALAGYARSQYELGLLFEYGRGVKRNDTAAVYWYQKSAAQGSSRAQYRLAVLCDNGWGNCADKAKAFKWYKSAAEGGHELAQHDLAIMFFEGSGTARSLLQAYKWLKIADLKGSSLMQKHLYMVSQEMSSDEIETADYMAKIWIESYGS